MKECILEAKYYPKTGISVLTKANKYGTFTATVQVHDEDCDIANEWDGLTFAEYKVDTMIMRERAHIFRERMLGIKSALMAIEPPEQDEEDYTWDKLVIQYDNAVKLYKKALNAYKKMRDNYRNVVDITLENRRKVRKFIEERNKNL